jgi:hypothetical protein
MGAVTAVDTPFHGRPHRLSITLPPLSMVMFEPEGDA